MDILDEDLDLGYTPSMVTGSRANKMKKINRKNQSKSTIHKPIKDEFDDLLDDMLSKEEQKNTKNKPTKVNKTHKENSDDWADQPQIDIGANKTSKISQPVINNTNLNTKPFKAKASFDDEIIEESNFGKTTQLFANQSQKIQSDINPINSMRVMKPPLRKRNSIQKSNMGLQQQSEIGIHRQNTSQELKIKMSIADEDRQYNKDVLPNPQKQSAFGNYSLSPKKKQNYQSMSKLMEPPKYDQKKSILIEEKKYNNTNNQETLATRNQQKQIEQMRTNFQKQLEFLQDNLDKQMQTNRSTRQKLMQETNSMIEAERKRSNAIHQEEIQRMKQMFQWEKKKLEDIYNNQIQSLKNALEYANQMAKIGKNVQKYNDRNEIQYLEQQLSNQRKIVKDREELLTKRQLDLQERQAQFNKKRRSTEQQLREEQRKILQMQTKLKKQIMQQKRAVINEKQQVAMEMAKVQIQAVKKNQKMSLQMADVHLQTEVITKQKHQIMVMNHQMMQKYKSRIQQLNQQKQKVKQLQVDLINKIRVVEMIGFQRQSTKNKTVNAIRPALKDNNWIDQHKNIKKVGHSTSKNADVIKVQERFSKLSHATRNNVFVEMPVHTKFKIEDYIYPMDRYNRQKLGKY